MGSGPNALAVVRERSHLHPDATNGWDRALASVPLLPERHDSVHQCDRHMNSHLWEDTCGRRGQALSPDRGSCIPLPAHDLGLFWLLSADHTNTSRCSPSITTLHQGLGTIFCPPIHNNGDNFYSCNSYCLFEDSPPPTSLDYQSLGRKETTF